jgi:hypothetical protein
MIPDMGGVAASATQAVALATSSETEIPLAASTPFLHTCLTVYEKNMHMQHISFVTQAFLILLPIFFPTSSKV